MYLLSQNIPGVYGYILAGYIFDCYTGPSLFISMDLECRPQLFILEIYV